MSERTSTIRAREIGSQLRRYRERTGLSQGRAGKKIALSTASMCRIEDGTKTPTPEEVSALLAVYGVVGPPRDTLLAIAREAAERGWWQRHNPEFGRRLNTLAGLESRACAITSFELGQIPGLLQSPVYVEAHMRESGLVVEREVRPRIDARIARQRVLVGDHPVHLLAFIDEAALYRMPGSAAVTHRQLDYLVRMAHKPNVIIRVVGFSAGAMPGAIGSFHLLGFGEAPSVVYTANWASELFMEDAAEVERYDDAVRWLSRKALDTGESIELIARLMRKLEEDPDVSPDFGWSFVAKK